jgi:hypothetical protein
MGRLRNNAKDARLDTTIVDLYQNKKSRRHDRAVECEHSVVAMKHVMRMEHEGTRRMMTVSAAGGNRNLHLVSVLPDERTESEDRH